MAGLSSIAKATAESRTGPGRRMNLLGEETLMDALDSACDVFIDNIARHELCQRTLMPHREALEEAVFVKDMEQLDSSMCLDILNICSAHEISSGGEL